MKFNALFLVIPVALMLVAGIWGWRNSDAMARSMPLDERTMEQRRRSYRRGSLACFVGAGLFVLLIVLSYQ